MLCLAIASIVFGLIGAVFTALAAHSAYKHEIFKPSEPGLYAIPEGSLQVFVFTMIATGAGAVAVILSGVAALIA